MEKPGIVSSSIEIEAPLSTVWTMITDKAYAKELGKEFDTGAFVESDWKLGSEVHFKYEPNRLVSTGTITQLIDNELIQVDYDFDGYLYEERYTIEEKNSTSILSIYAGPYTSDYEDQKVVWGNWLSKVKELSEKIA
ncbi:MAG: SRPBCC domain-containing protein [Bacteroidota bacterium]